MSNRLSGDCSIPKFFVPYLTPADNTGRYVLAIEQKATILGQQNIVVSLPVTVVETGDTTAAVSGALDADTQVIVSSTRAVQAGDRVKIHDAS